MATSAFVHLHNHSEYSLLDGACRISEMVDWAYDNSVPAVALTDHGNMFGAYEFYITAKEKGVNPIVGCEVYVAPDSRNSREQSQRKPYHLTLIVENEVGYKNLMRLVSVAYIEGFYFRPRIDMEVLREYHEGIIALTGCINGFVPALIGEDQAAAVKNLQTLMDVMGKDNLYVEIQNHGLDLEQQAMPPLIKIAEEFGLPLVGTNDSHYLSKGDHNSHDILLCVQTGKSVNDQQRLAFENQFYLKTIDEMHQVFKDYPAEVITNTVDIATRCQLNLSYGQNIMPEYKVPGGHTADSYLKGVCFQGLNDFAKSESPNGIEDRLNYELSVIEQTGYAGYFLIVWDYVNYARNQGFPLNARGSAGGSLVLYALGVTTFNPIDYGCIFERFLNLERVDMPDIDIDFAPEHRDLVIQYLIDKYGAESVGYVATFNTLGARQAIRDVGRVLDMPLGEVDRLAKQIPSIPGITIDEALDEAPQFKEVAAEPQNADLMHYATSLEGIKRHVSIHASGIVLANGALTDYVPLFKDKNDRIATQFELQTLAKVGMVKFDFLGLRTLSEVHNCLERVNRKHDLNLKLDDIPFDDAETYKLIGKGFVAGLFQLETSPGMKRVIMQIKPDKFEDFIPIPALYRPGPLDSGMMDSFIRRKLGLEKVSYLHPVLEEILRETYGVCIYQEQVMQIAQAMAGFSLGEADVLRYAMGKKKADLLQEQEEKFIDGCVKNNISSDKAIEVFEYLQPFGRYAFNKSHTTAYAILSYQMAYLKTHYPHEFMSSMMTGESAYSEKIMKYMVECKKLADFFQTEIRVLPPDINSSETTFTVVDCDIRFGLAAVKNVSQGAIQAIVDARMADGPFDSLQDFCQRVDSSAINKRAIESLIMAGAFDTLGDGHRAQYLSGLDRALKAAQSAQSDIAKGQMSLFSGDDDADSQIQFELEELEEMNYDEKLDNEKEMLGFYLSGHPLEQYEDLLEFYATVTSESLYEHRYDAEVYVIGMISEVRVVTTKKSGDRMAIVTLEDLEGSVPMVIFPETYEVSRALIEKNKVVWVRGDISVDMRSKKTDDDGNEIDARQIQVNEVVAIEDLVESKTSSVEVVIPKVTIPEPIEQLKKLCAKYRGEHDLILRLTDSKFGEVIVQCGGKFRIKDSENAIKDIESLFGESSVYRSNRTHRQGDQTRHSVSSS